MFPNHNLLLNGGFTLQIFKLSGKEEDGQLHRDSCFNLVFLFPSINLILPVQPDAHIALLYWMLDLTVIDRQSNGLSCEAVRFVNMHNDQQQLSQSVACVTKYGWNEEVIDFHIHIKACVGMLQYEAECKNL